MPDRPLRTCLSLLCAAGVAAALSSGARGADGDRLLFTSNRSGNFEIYLANADGSDAKNLTNKDGEDNGATWSPDGKKIAFASDRGGNFDIYVMDADGSGVKQLTTDPAKDRAPAWSPDGKKIAWVRHLAEENWQVFVMDADGGNQANVTNRQGIDADPAWSADGKKLLYVSLADQGFQMKTTDPAGGGVETLSGPEKLLGWIYPAWSSDGKKLAYTAGAGENELEIHTCDADGGNRKQLTTLKGVNTYAAWSRDGKRIAFQHHDKGDANGALWVMDANGGNARQVVPAECPIEGGRPAWKP